MIPPDLAASVRLLSQAGAVDHQTGVEGASNVRELQARLPQLLPGQQFSAIIQRSFSDGTFQAIVAGRNLTLALSQSAQPGDVLSLIATEVKGNTVLARPADVVADAQVSGQANLSSAGRLISALLTGQNASGPTQLAGGSPLVSSPPADASAARQMLAPALQQALTQSGLFYESHQQKWLSGKVQVADMLMEPQGKLSALLQQGRAPVLAQAGAAPAAAAATANAAATSTAAAAGAAANAATAASVSNASLTASLAAANAAPGAAAAPAAGAAAAASANSAINAAYSASVLAGLFADPQLVAGATGQSQEAGLLNELARNLELVMRSVQSGQGEAAGKPAQQPAAEGAKAQQAQQAARDAAQMLKNAAAGGGEELKNVAREAVRVNAAEAQQQAASAQQAAARQVIPERLAPIVHQQLESLATQNYLMQGMAWPGQKFEWEVEDEGHGAHGEEGELQEWKTTLRVIMPNMGGVEARIALTASGVSLRLVAEYDDTVDKLTQASAELAEALEAADVPLTGFVAEKLKEKPAPAQEQAQASVEEGNDG